LTPAYAGPDAPRVPLLLAVLLPVVVYCSVRAVAPGLGGAGVEHRRDIDTWHVLMGLAMAAMLLGTLTRPLAVAALAVCAAGLGWGVLSVERRSGGSAHLRLVVGAAAMAVMTLPPAAPAMASGGESGGMAGMTAGQSALPLVLVLLAGLVGVAAVRLPAAVRRSPGRVARLDAGCDVVMVGAMAAMLVALL
jgi:hypothetical protein